MKDLTISIVLKFTVRHEDITVLVINLVVGRSQSHYDFFALPIVNVCIAIAVLLRSFCSSLASSSNPCCNIVLGGPKLFGREFGEREVLCSIGGTVPVLR